jgi:hypothetical protein
MPPSPKTPERKQAVYAACSTHTGVVAAAASVGVAKYTVDWWKTSDRDWYERCKEACQRTRAIKRSKLQKTRPRRWDQPVDKIDFLAFRERYFKHKTFWYHADAYGRIESNDGQIMLLPPEHAKTTTWSIEYATYKLMMNPDIRIVIFQKSQVEAKKIIAAVKARLTNHEFYQNLGIPIEHDPITVYGGPDGFKPEREDGLQWGAEAFYLRGRSFAEKDPSMQAKGYTSGILGNRIDLVIIDDVQDSKNFTMQGLDSLKQWFTHDLMSRLGDVFKSNSKIIILGSRIGPGDFYEWLLQEYGLEEDGEYPEGEAKMRWPVTKYPAILNEETKEVLCPDLWSWEGLMVKKFQVKEKWWSNWMQAEGDEEGQTFKREKLLEARNRDYILGSVPPQVTDVFVGVDPAIRNYAAFICWGLDRKTGNRYLIDVENRKGMGNWDNVAALTVELADRYDARIVVVETNNTQGDVFWRVESACRKIGVRCKGYQTVSATGARNEETEFSISSIGALFDADMVVLPYGDADSAKRVDAYIDQLCNWRPRPSGTSSWHLTRDMVMATLFAESEAREVVRRASRPRLLRRREMPVFVENTFDVRKTATYKSSTDEEKRWIAARFGS